MLSIHIPKSEKFNNLTGEFIYIKEQTLHLEHSLISISKWESKWHKPFLSKEEKTEEEIAYYVRCMIINNNVDAYACYGLTEDNYKEISNYIEDPMTATWFKDDKSKPTNHEIITSELIYYWMIALNIPVEFEKWHINRLLTLIKICNIKNTPPKKMSKNEILNRNRALNEARRQANHSKG